MYLDELENDPQVRRDRSQEEGDGEREEPVEYGPPRIPDHLAAKMAARGQASSHADDDAPPVSGEAELGAAGLAAMGFGGARQVPAS